MEQVEGEWGRGSIGRTRVTEKSKVWWILEINRAIKTEGKSVESLRVQGGKRK